MLLYITTPAPADITRNNLLIVWLLFSAALYIGQEEPCSDLGLFLPVLNESTWDWRVRAVLYLTGMFYSFLGVSIVSDLFMSAIKKINNKTNEISIRSKDRRLETTVLEIPVWNGTVANLTLMVLGTSAPEILLAIIRTIGNNFQSEKIGPSTIVGSAAFNLLAVSDNVIRST